MGAENGLLGVVIAIVGVVGSVLVARISNPRRRDQDDERDEREPTVEGGNPQSTELKVSPEIWRRFTVLEQKVDHLTALVEEMRERVSALERLLRLAMRIIRRANRRLRAAELPPEEVPAELVRYSIE
ncbi:hypothetical protein ACFRH6_14620 [Streptomyces sp. NPDC056749]|uniref:hypothetical protein n=1 Tax=Streptomyces sp. NPDC056749 TaxID=3345936 RepID=UPI0036D09326